MGILLILVIAASAVWAWRKLHCSLRIERLANRQRDIGVHDLMLSLVWTTPRGRKNAKLALYSTLRVANED